MRPSEVKHELATIHYKIKTELATIHYKLCTVQSEQECM